MAKLLKATCGDTVFLYDESEEAKANVESQIRERLLRGEIATLADGSKQWIDDVEVVDFTKSGSDQYTWSKDGNKVLHRRELFTKAPHGKITKTLLRKIYKPLS